jgi:hypothetical protein
MDFRDYAVDCKITKKGICNNPTRRPEILQDSEGITFPCCREPNSDEIRLPPMSRRQLDLIGKKLHKFKKDVVYYHGLFQELMKDQDDKKAYTFLWMDLKPQFEKDIQDFETVVLTIVEMMKICSKEFRAYKNNKATFQFTQTCHPIEDTIRLMEEQFYPRLFKIEDDLASINNMSKRDHVKKGKLKYGYKAFKKLTSTLARTMNHLWEHKEKIGMWLFTSSLPMFNTMMTATQIMIGGGPGAFMKFRSVLCTMFDNPEMSIVTGYVFSKLVPILFVLIRTFSPLVSMAWSIVNKFFNLFGGNNALVETADQLKKDLGVSFAKKDGSFGVTVIIQLFFIVMYRNIGSTLGYLLSGTCSLGNAAAGAAETVVQSGGAAVKTVGNMSEALVYTGQTAASYMTNKIGGVSEGLKNMVMGVSSESVDMSREALNEVHEKSAALLEEILVSNTTVTTGIMKTAVDKAKVFVAIIIANPMIIGAVIAFFLLFLNYRYETMDNKIPDMSERILDQYYNATVTEAPKNFGSRTLISRKKKSRRSRKKKNK